MISAADAFVNSCRSMALNDALNEVETLIEQAIVKKEVIVNYKLSDDVPSKLKGNLLRALKKYGYFIIELNPNELSITWN